MSDNDKKLSPKHASDFLKLINDASDETTREQLLKQYGVRPPLNMLLQLNFNDKIKLDLPPGAPPHKRDEQTHPDLMTPLATQVNRLKACTVWTKIPKFKKEQVFIQVIECIPPCDADVLVACKDKALNEMYPQITLELIKKVHPSFL